MPGSTGRPQTHVQCRPLYCTERGGQLLRGGDGRGGGICPAEWKSNLKGKLTGNLQSRGIGSITYEHNAFIIMKSSSIAGHHAAVVASRIQVPTVGKFFFFSGTDKKYFRMFFHK